MGRRREAWGGFRGAVKASSAGAFAAPTDGLASAKTGMGREEVRQAGRQAGKASKQAGRQRPPGAMAMLCRYGCSESRESSSCAGAEARLECAMAWPQSHTWLLSMSNFVPVCACPSAQSKQTLAQIGLGTTPRSPALVPKPSGAA